MNRPTSIIPIGLKGFSVKRPRKTLTHVGLHFVCFFYKIAFFGATRGLAAGLTSSNTNPVWTYCRLYQSDPETARGSLSQLFAERSRSRVHLRVRWAHTGPPAHLQTIGLMQDTIIPFSPLSPSTPLQSAIKITQRVNEDPGKHKPVGQLK